MAEIIVKLERDQARAVKNYFHPYLVQLVDLLIRDSQDNIDEQINYKAIRSLFNEISKILEKRLLSKGNKFNIELSFAHACAWYFLLMRIPIHESQVYLVQLRQTIIDSLHKQMLDDAPGTYSGYFAPLPETITMQTF